MQPTRHLFLILALLPVMIFLATGCGGDDNDPVAPEEPDPTVLSVVVRSEVDSSFVEGANVVVYRAETREAEMRALTSADGGFNFDMETGNYYLDVSAQGYDPVPAQGVAPIPFFVSPEDTTGREIWLDDHGDAGSTGSIQGYIDPAEPNFLVLASSTGGQGEYTTASGPDGFFVLFNLPYGQYDVRALQAGWLQDAPVTATLADTTQVDTVTVPVTAYDGSVLTGSVTFLASENSTVDITLLDPETRAVVPGLSVMSDPGNLNYRIEGIPDGDYIAWASLANDGYVIDPDWLFKNPGGLDLSFDTVSQVDLDFSVTDAIPLVFPTNPADSTTAAMADSTVPEFTWMSYPSAKEYFIEVRNFSGDVLWGGFDETGAAQHGFIGAQIESVRYNFDAQPDAPELEPGQVYQWTIWADLGTKQDSFVEQLISSSEDLRGIFQVPAPPEESAP